MRSAVDDPMADRRDPPSPKPGRQLRQHLRRLLVRHARIERFVHQCRAGRIHQAHAGLRADAADMAAHENGRRRPPS